MQHSLWVKRSLFLFFILLPAKRVAKAQCADLWAQKRERQTTGLMARQSAARGHSESAVLRAACNIGNIALTGEFNKNIMSRWLMIQIISSASLMSKNQRAVWWLAQPDRTVIRRRAHNTYFQPSQPPWQINLRVLDLSLKSSAILRPVDGTRRGGFRHSFWRSYDFNLEIFNWSENS